MGGQLSFYYIVSSKRRFGGLDDHRPALFLYPKANPKTERSTQHDTSNLRQRRPSGMRYCHHSLPYSPDGRKPFFPCAVSACCSLWTCGRRTMAGNHSPTASFKNFRSPISERPCGALLFFELQTVFECVAYSFSYFVVPMRVWVKCDSVYKRYINLIPDHNAFICGDIYYFADNAASVLAVLIFDKLTL